ncbi:MAG: cytosine/creatinine deaminase [Nocardioidaceae bacterium]|nr:cytosine/creatinine deaminase [Nocardioidaceae bacterium]
MQFTITNATLPNGEVVNLHLDGGQVASVGQGAGAVALEQVDADGGLLLPAFIDTHVHLDKVLTRDGAVQPDGTLEGAIAVGQQVKRSYTVDNVRGRARAVIHSSVMTGTTRLRSHVDVDSIAGLVALKGVLAAARDCAYIAEVTTVAFPQEGILRDPGTAELMVEAMRAGADVVGGMPHWERTEDDQREHVRICFDIAEQFDADVDMHVDETDDGSVRTLEMVVAETVDRGWQGRVTAGHACALPASDHTYSERVIAACAEAGVTVVANPMTNLVLQGRADHGLIRRGTTSIRELLAAGVNVAFGQDCISDAFTPFGRGDMLEVAMMSAHVAHLTSQQELDVVLAGVTTSPAKSWRIGDRYGVQRGARADLQLYAASTWPEVLRRQDPPTHVWHSGRLVARTSVVRQLFG